MSDELTPVQEFQQWAKEDPDIRSIANAACSREGVRSIAELHDQCPDAFADVYDAVAQMIADLPLYKRLS